MGDSPTRIQLPGATLRRAVPDEASVLTDLAFRSKAYWGYDEQFMATCKDELTVSPEAIRCSPTVVAEAQRIVGFYMLRPLDEDDVELEFLFVAPEEIAHGYGRQLLDHAKAETRARGYQSIVIQGDPHADGFYRSQGGEWMGNRPSASIKGRLLPVYRISLDATR